MTSTLATPTVGPSCVTAGTAPCPHPQPQAPRGGSDWVTGWRKSCDTLVTHIWPGRSHTGFDASEFGAIQLIITLYRNNIYNNNIILLFYYYYYTYYINILYYINYIIIIQQQYIIYDNFIYDNKWALFWKSVTLLIEWMVYYMCI